MLFKINLATRIYINTKLLKLCTLGVIVLGLFFIFLNITTISTRAGEIKSLSTRLAGMDVRLKDVGKSVSEKEYKAVLTKIDFANAIIEKKMFNWLALLDSLERVVPEGVAISSIEPDPKSQTLKLAGVGRSFRNLRIFMENLEDSKYFTDVYLTSQGYEKLIDTTQGVNFSLTCKVTTK
jgi:type IV pilus assembly protein PilN